MRFTARKALVNLALFAAALCLVLYVNSGQSWQSSAIGRKVDWTTIRYITGADVPEHRGLCPGISGESLPALVVAHVEDNGNLKWLDDLQGKYHFCVYRMDRESDGKRHELQVPANKGHEAMAYLTFIIDNYPNIPASGAVFVHGSRFSWHNDEPTYDNLPLLRMLDVGSALEGPGYHNLRCDWSTSTCAKDYGPAQTSMETQLNAAAQPWDLRAKSDSLMAESIVTLFGGFVADEQARLKRGEKIMSQCCGQFVVSRDRIWQHSLKEYTALRQWLLDGRAPEDDKVSGRIVSYLWHILFLRKEVMNEKANAMDIGRLNQLACPSAQDCYCKLYGRCDLQNCDVDRCHGQYSVPPNFALPDDYAETHAQSYAETSAPDRGDSYKEAVYKEPESSSDQAGAINSNNLGLQADDSNAKPMGELASNNLGLPLGDSTSDQASAPGRADSYEKAVYQPGDTKLSQASSNQVSPPGRGDSYEDAIYQEPDTTSNQASSSEASAPIRDDSYENAVYQEPDSSSNQASSNQASSPSQGDSYKDAIYQEPDGSSKKAEVMRPAVDDTTARRLDIGSSLDTSGEIANDADDKKSRLTEWGLDEDGGDSEERKEAEDSRKEAESEQQAQDSRKEADGTLQEADAETDDAGPTRKEAEASRKEAERKQQKEDRRLEADTRKGAATGGKEADGTLQEADADTNGGSTSGTRKGAAVGGKSAGRKQQTEDSPMDADSSGAAAIGGKEAKADEVGGRKPQASQPAASVEEGDLEDVLKPIEV
ncbi:hypothetical protein B0A50_05915 [Salinomyces thailandicus]|uniref:Uncharacterized protein n=1 Tax=Salinomyces thailandicus TaxID=706561 RepID=A0A4U0TSW2_9PEZI|nr:hypothetical protein B0A50_05915 [Salinomyces thailandica]